MRPVREISSEEIQNIEVNYFGSSIFKQLEAGQTVSVPLFSKEKTLEIGDLVTIALNEVIDPDVPTNTKKVLEAMIIEKAGENKFKIQIVNKD
jgi:flagellar basal body L-ring protein FlgH